MVGCVRVVKVLDISSGVPLLILQRQVHNFARHGCVDSMVVGRTQVSNHDWVFGIVVWIWNSNVFELIVATLDEQVLETLIVLITSKCTRRRRNNSSRAQAGNEFWCICS